jgi:hypothetical protein
MAVRFNEWTRWVIFAASALIALGGYMVTVRNNTKRIVNVENKTATIEKEYGNAIATLQTDVQWIKQGIERIELAVKK